MVYADVVIMLLFLDSYRSVVNLRTPRPFVTEGEEYALDYNARDS